MQGKMGALIFVTEMLATDHACQGVLVAPLHKGKKRHRRRKDLVRGTIFRGPPTKIVPCAVVAIAEGNGGALVCGGGCFLEATKGVTSLLSTHTKVSGPQVIAIYMVLHTSA
jgi:hypothetical protein